MKLLPLSKGYTCIVDDEDFEKLSQFKWCAYPSHNQVYACARMGNGHVLMHRFLLNAPRGVLVDHVNGTHVEMFLDNQRSNLRLASCSLNQRNHIAPKHDGVWFRKARNKWIAQAKIRRKVHWLGSFATRDQAMKRLNQWKTDVGFSDSETPVTEILEPKAPL